MKFCRSRETVIPEAADESQGKNQYGNYYDDVPVADLSKSNRKKTNNGKTLYVCLVVFGLVISIAVCVTVMCLL